MPWCALAEKKKEKKEKPRSARTSAPLRESEREREGGGGVMRGGGVTDCAIIFASVCLKFYIFFVKSAIFRLNLCFNDRE